MKHIPCALTIAGTDPTGGAGIQADLKTFQELKSYGMSIITSVVAQNTTGVQAVHHLPLEMIEQQLTSVISDVPVHAFKTGMIANIDMMKVILNKMTELNAAYVMDPVMVATSGDPLIADDARDFLKKQLLPRATIVTPNIPEAEVLTGEKIETEGDMKEAAVYIVDQLGAQTAIVKGGHLAGDAIDYFYDGKQTHAFSSERIYTKNTHGTGCTLSAAITAYLSQGLPLRIAVEKAKKYVTLAIKHSLNIGSGHGPTNHWAPRIEEV